MKKATLTILGIATLLLSLTLNFKHALNDYGILDNKLHVEVLAQSNSSGGEGGSSSDSWWDRTKLFAVMDYDLVYDTNLTMYLGYKGISLELGSYKSGFIGYLYYCRTSINTCDTSREGLYSTPTGSGT